MAAVALVNSAEAPDSLTTPDDLDAFLAAHPYAGPRVRPAAELAGVRRLRRPLRELLTGGREEAARLVNRIFTEHSVRLQLVRHDGWDYHLHAVDARAPLTGRIAVATAMAVADLIRAGELGRLSICADRTCGGIVVDLSRNRSRRFCSVACGNRVAAAAYRSRKRDDDAEANS
ncbi:CGNR zinc finger domain-containing protein [Amorphoplanes nipponensis]|uniref:Zinc finger CGNR domain-containing protein n=1 Tax=Actinoplanes nipponensis TaxID=135950 RepID=A0A919JR65_9ACTN|nr:CGNR zinc finger domain-containing protein [Actinoplanes nipponensis]GIE54278.1 hypothetical protein Ani05nite_78120 [Actinoplanes nipponensis]